MDEEQVQTQAENEDVKADVTESPAVEETTTDVPEEVSEESKETPEEPKPKNNAQNRLKEVLGERKQLRNENENLRSLLERSSQVSVPDNISEEDYRALVASATMTAADVQQLKQQIEVERFVNEVEAVEREYPELNPDSDQYNEELALQLSAAYEEGFVNKDRNGNFIGAKKSIREFTASMIKPYRDALARGATQAGAALEAQAGEAVVTPQKSSTSAPKAFKDKSIAEMEKQLGFHKS